MSYPLRASKRVSGNGVPADQHQKLDLKKPINRGLVFCSYPKIGCADLVSGKNIAVSSGCSNIDSELGTVLNQSAANDYAYFDVYPELTNEITIVFAGVITTADGWGCLVSRPYRAAGWSSPYSSIAMQHANTTRGGWLHLATGSGTRSTSGTPGNFFLHDNEYHIYEITRSFNEVVFYRDGVAVHADLTFTTDDIDVGESQPIHIMNRNHLIPGEACSGDCYFAAVYNVAKTAEEVAESFISIRSGIEGARSWYPVQSIVGQLTQTVGWSVLSQSLQSSAWHVKAQADQAAAWALYNSLGQSSGWHVRASQSRATSWRLLNQVKNDSSWLVKGRLDRSSGWSLRAGVSVPSAWNVLNSSGQATAWRVFNSSSQDSSWKVLTSGQLSQAIAWLVLGSLQQASAWHVLDHASTDSSWRVKGRLSHDAGWSVLSSHQQASLWRVLSSDSMATSWRVLNSSALPSSWRVLASELAQSGWRIIAATSVDSAWVVAGVDELPLDRIELTVSQREIIASVSGRKILIDAKARTIIFTA